MPGLANDDISTAADIMADFPTKSWLSEEENGHL